MEDRPVSSSYPTRYSGRNLGKTMPMWRVQTEGYLDEKGFLVGVVSHGAQMDASPDCEYISGGMNAKGVDSVAIGRQGSFLHWGFAADPDYLTDEARLVFVNAVHYISRFAGRHALVHKVSGVMTRDSVDDMLFGISDTGYAAWCAMIDDVRAQRTKMVDGFKQRQAAGEELSDFEKQIIGAPPMPDWDRADSVKYVVPAAIRAKFGDDWDAYNGYYTTNRPYLHPGEVEGWMQPLVVDEDARTLGIANNDVALLERCIGLLERGEDVDRATRLLERYTQQSFADADAWKQWLDTYRDVLFFSEYAGYVFLVDTNAMPAAGTNNAAELDKAISSISVPMPTYTVPVRLEAVVVRTSDHPGAQATLVVKGRITSGWHIYAYVPPGQPYATTRLDVTLPDGVALVGEWGKPEAIAAIGAPQLQEYIGTVVFKHPLQIDAGSTVGAAEITVNVAYQACDMNGCLPPQTVTLKAKLVE